MSKENLKTTEKLTVDQPAQKEKLPYVKPELHRLDLDGTEGKTFTSVKENTITSPSSSKFGPS